MPGDIQLFNRGKRPGEPIIFVGGPESLEADVWLLNDTDEDLALEQATVFSAALQREQQRIEVARITIPSVVSVRQRALLSESFDVDSTTPPGTYDAEIRLEGE